MNPSSCTQTTRENVYRYIELSREYYPKASNLISKEARDKEHNQAKQRERSCKWESIAYG